MSKLLLVVLLEILVLTQQLLVIAFEIAAELTEGLDQFIESLRVYA